MGRNGRCHRMFFPAVASDPKRRSKVVADRLFCVGCLVLCTSGPALLVLGTLLFTAVDNRSTNMEAYNTAVDAWNANGGGLQQFDASSFSVTVRPRGSLRNMTSNVLEPFSEVRTTLHQRCVSIPVPPALRKLMTALARVRVHSEYRHQCRAGWCIRWAAANGGRGGPSSLSVSFSNYGCAAGFVSIGGNRVVFRQCIALDREC